MYRVGILGLDYWYGAYRLARALQEHNKARLVGVFDEQPERSAKLTHVFGAQQVFSPEELINRDDLDIVFIAASSNKIPEYGILAASANKHLIVGKPIARTLEEANRLVAAVERSKGKIVTMESCDSSIITLIDANVMSLIASGQIGQVVRIQSISHSSVAESWYSSGKPGWFADPTKSPGGAFIDYAIYDLEVLKYIAKTPISKIHFARIGNLVHHDLPVEDWGVAHFSFENGIEASMEASWTIVTPNITKPSPKVNSYSHFEIIGTKGRILFDLLPYEHVSVLTNTHPYWAYFRTVKSQTESEPPIFGPLENLIDCIEKNQDPIAGIHDARDCLEAIMEMYNKAKL